KSNGDSSALINVRARSKPDRVANAIPAFVKRDGQPRQNVQWVARKREIVECRAALRSAEHLQRDLAAKMRRARHTRTAIAHGVVRASRRATEMRKFVERIGDGTAPRVAHLHIAKTREHP